MGAVVGVRWQPPHRLVAVVLTHAAGALIVSTSFELFEPAYEGGGSLRAGTAFIAGVLMFVVADTWLDRRTAGSAAGLAFLAGVTLDGIPESTAPGLSLNNSASLALAHRRVRQQLSRGPRRSAPHGRTGRSPQFVVAFRPYWLLAAVERRTLVLAAPPLILVSGAPVMVLGPLGS